MSFFSGSATHTITPAHTAFAPIPIKKPTGFWTAVGAFSGIAALALIAFKARKSLASNLTSLEGEPRSHSDAVVTAVSSPLLSYRKRAILEGFNRWIESAPSERDARTIARDRMIDCMDRGSTTLDLSFLEITSLPEDSFLWRSLDHVKTFQFSNTLLEQLPDAINSEATLLLSSNGTMVPLKVRPDQFHVQLYIMGVLFDLIAQDRSQCRIVPPYLQNDRDFWITIYSRHSDAYPFLPSPMKESKEFLLGAIRCRIYPPLGSWEADKQFLVECMQANHQFFSHLPQELQTEELQLLFIQTYPYELPRHPELIENREFLLKVLKAWPEVFYSLPFLLQKERAFLEIAFQPFSNGGEILRALREIQDPAHQEMCIQETIRLMRCTKDPHFFRGHEDLFKAIYAICDTQTYRSLFSFASRFLLAPPHEEHADWQKLRETWGGDSIRLLQLSTDHLVNSREISPLHLDNFMKFLSDQFGKGVGRKWFGDRNHLKQVIEFFSLLNDGYIPRDALVTKSMLLSTIDDPTQFAIFSMLFKSGFFTTLSQFLSQDLRLFHEMRQLIDHPDVYKFKLRKKELQEAVLEVQILPVLGLLSIPSSQIPHLLTRWETTFGSMRQPLSVLRYIQRHIDGPGKESLQLLIASVLQGTFLNRRYDPTHNPVFKVLEEKEALIEEWKRGASQDRKDPGSRIVDTDDFRDVFLCGTEISGSCQNVDYGSELNVCLLGYLLHGQTRMVAIKDKEGVIQGRAMVRLVLNEKEEPALFLEPIYVKQALLNTPAAGALKMELASFAMERAKTLGLPIYYYQRAAATPYPLKTLGGGAPFEFFDQIWQLDNGTHALAGKEAHGIAQLFGTPLTAPEQLVV
jgi:hypothetical protein